MDMVAAAYEAARHYSTSERYVLSAQLRRAAISVVANITEGHARPGARQLRAFLEIAYGSALECEVLLMVSVRVGALSEAQVAQVRDATSKVARQLFVMLRKLRAIQGRR